MRDHEFLLDFSELMMVDYHVEFMVVADIDLLKGSKHSFDIAAVGVIFGSVLAYFLHEQNVAGESLDWFDEVGLQREHFVLGADANASKVLFEVLVAFEEFIDEFIALLEVVEVFEVEFEEMHLLLDLIENQFVVRVRPG